MTGWLLENYLIINGLFLDLVFRFKTKWSQYFLFACNLFLYGFLIVYFLDFFLSWSITKNMIKILYVSNFSHFCQWFGDIICVLQLFQVWHIQAISIFLLKPVFHVIKQQFPKAATRRRSSFRFCFLRSQNKLFWSVRACARARGQTGTVALTGENSTFQRFFRRFCPVLWPSLLPSPPDRSSVFTSAEMDQNSELFGKTTCLYNVDLTLPPFHLR